MKTKKEVLTNSIDHLANAKTDREILEAVKWALIHVLHDMRKNLKTEPENPVSVHTVASREQL